MLYSKQLRRNCKIKKCAQNPISVAMDKQKKKKKKLMLEKVSTRSYSIQQDFKSSYIRKR